MRNHYKKISLIASLCMLLTVQLSNVAHAETALFPIDSFGVAGPIPTPGNIGDLVGAPSAGTAVQFDPGDLGFLLFDSDITGVSTGTPNTALMFDIISAIPSATGQTFVSVLLGNIGAGPSFTIAPISGLVAPNGVASIFQFTEVSGSGIFSIDTSAFLAGCAEIGGCNSIVIGTSGLGAAGGGGFADGGTLTFASVTAASPEPSSWAFMILGFLALAYQAKKEKLRRSASHALAMA